MQHEGVLRDNGQYHKHLFQEIKRLNWKLLIGSLFLENVLTAMSGEMLKCMYIRADFDAKRGNRRMFLRYF